MCRGDKKKTTGSPGPGKRKSKQGKENKQTTHLVKDSTNEDDVYTATMYHLQEGNKVKAFEVDHIKWKSTLAQPELS